MRFGLLGSLDVHDGVSKRTVPAPKQRVILAALLLRPNQVVDIDRLSYHLWGDAPPDGAHKTVQTYVRRLRPRLGEAAGRLHPQPPGYLIEVGAGELDIDQFTECADRGTAAVRAGRLTEAAERFREALGIWRGDPLIDIPGLQDEAAHLAEARFTVLGSRLDVDLRLGRHAQLIGELQQLIAEYPLREQLHAQLMLALYRSQRTADALTVFNRCRDRLIEELGVEPGQPLRSLHARVLAADPELDWHAVPAADASVGERTNRAASAARSARSAAATDTGRGETAPRNDLPRDLSDFAGRAADLRALTGARSPDNAAAAVIAIDGMPGVGKTALAVHLGHLLRAEFPDGCHFVDLDAHTVGRRPAEPAAVLRKLLQARGVPAQIIPGDLEDLSAAWRAEVFDRRVLVILDNAASAFQVRPLLPASPESLVLITSRTRLSDVDGAFALSVDVLPAAEAAAMFRMILGDRAADQEDAVAEVVRLCGFLPLAIRIAAARLRSRSAWTVATLQARLADQRRLLTELATGERGVAAAFALSQQQLTAAQARMFWLLGLQPGVDIETVTAAALAGLEHGQAEDLLEGLLDANLVQQRTVGRYRLHDLLRAHARDQALEHLPDGDRASALTRLAGFYVVTADAADRLLNSGRRDIDLDPAAVAQVPVGFLDNIAALHWCDAEYDNLVAVIADCAESGRHALAWQLTVLLTGYFMRRGNRFDWIDVLRRGLASAEAIGDGVGQSWIVSRLAAAYAEVGMLDQAGERFGWLLDYFRRSGEQVGEASTLSNLAVVHGLTGRHEEAAEHLIAALTVYRRIGNRVGEGIALENLGRTHLELGRHRKAIECSRQAIDICLETGKYHVVPNALNNIGEAHRSLGELSEAEAAQRQALAASREHGFRNSEARSLAQLGRTRRLTGDVADALDLLEQASALLEELGDAEAGQVRSEIDELRSAR
jgi:DNA-binding SARP family transcriptional activator